MGFLRRLVGGTSTRGLNVNVNYFRRVRDAAVVQVVGEAYRQSSVARARQPGPNDLPPGLPAPPAGYFKAMLIAEPSNQYDSNAIAVYLWAGGAWSQAGYLSRQDASAYQPLFRHLARSAGVSPPGIACDAASVSERGGIGMVLHLGTPGECIAELVTDDRSPTEGHPWVGKVIAFTGQSETTIHAVPIEREAQVMLARWAGCAVLPRVTKKVDALIDADPDELTGNHQKAIAYGIPVVSEAAFLSAIGIPSDTIGRVAGRWARG
jgi:hypothetical protein